MARLFLSLELPEAIRDELSSSVESSHALAWVPRDQLHLTLRFLGDWPAERLDDLIGAMLSVRVEPFLLSLKGCGTFPPDETAQVFWLGVGSGHPRLHQLRQRIDDALLGLETGADLHRFQPHVTLARLRSGHVSGALRPLSHRFSAYESAPFRIAGFGLFSSVLHSAGAVHQRIAWCPFQVGSRAP